MHRKENGRRGKRTYRIVTDLPDVLPVTEAELDMLETAFADLIAELLNGDEVAPREDSATERDCKRPSGIFPKGR